MSKEKTMKRIITFCCICLSLLSQAQTAQVHIAGNNYPVEFEDTALSSADRQRIASDLAVPFSFVLSFEELKGWKIEAKVPLPNGGTSVTSIDGRDYWAGVYQPSVFSPAEPCHTIILGFRRHPCRTVFSQPELDGCFILDYNGKKSVLINKAFSDMHLSALGQMDAHLETVQKAKAFVALLNSPDLLSQPIHVLRDLYCFICNNVETDNPLSDNALREVFVKMGKGYQYLGITALSFFPEAPEELGGEGPVSLMFVSSMVAMDTGDRQHLLGYLIEFRHGRWQAVQLSRRMPTTPSVPKGKGQ